MKEDKTIAVIFLMWLPSGFEQFRQFIASYNLNKAGIDHGLVILFNGVKDQSETEPYHSFLREHAITFTPLYLEKGLDIDAYFFASKSISSEYLFFLNTYSTLLSENWLKKMYDHITLENTGMVSATGSWQSYSSMGWMMYPLWYEFKKSFRHNYRKYKLFIKSAIYYKLFFPGFPNPHLRSNAFMIRRDLFLSIRYKAFTSKMLAYRFESGRNSISKQVLKKNKKLLVVDKYGAAHEMKNWYESKTFWNSGQENLMITDNQTEKYSNAGPEEKKLYTYLAWGKK